jgi:hypothetical protein
MGTCCSCFKRNNEDEEGRSLLAGNNSENATSIEGSLYSQITQPRGFKQREIEALKKIVKRTADGLIDASSFWPSDTLHQPDNPFSSLTNLLKPEGSFSNYPQSSLPTGPLPPSKIAEILCKSGPTCEEVQLIQSALAQITDSLKDFKVEDCGELVATLNLLQ